MSCTSLGKEVTVFGPQRVQFFFSYLVQGYVVALIFVSSCLVFVWFVPLVFCEGEAQRC